MEEEKTKKENIITSKKSTVDKKMEKDLLEEFDDDVDIDVDEDEKIHDESSILLAEDVPEPEYDENEVLLSWYDSDLNLVIDEATFTIASPVHDGGFCFLQAGARATYGYNSGKVCFEVKFLENCKLSFKKGHLFPYVLRVGWSSVKSSLQLGTDKKSYGFDNSGRITTAGEIVEYGRKFKMNDVVGAYLDISDETATFSFTLNGEDQGIAYQVPQSELEKEPLFPHVLAKNLWYQCNFKGEVPWFPPKEGYTFVGDVPLSDRISGPKRPLSKSDCEVVMMCGLPKVGKTSWVNKLREENPGMYYIIDPIFLIDSEELKDTACKKIILNRTKVLGKLLAMAMDRRRNYILDQTNLIRSEQIWKLRLFKGFKRRIVVIVLSDEEYVSRLKMIDEKSKKSLGWLLHLKAKFILPTMKRSPINSFVDQIDYVALPQSKALRVVKSYHQEAWGRGYKPNKFFVIPPYFKLGKKKGKWKKSKIEKQGLKDKDFPDSGTGDQVSPSPQKSRRSPPAKKRMREDWQSSGKCNNQDWSSPPRSRRREDWNSLPEKKMSGDRLSAPRKSMNKVWLAPSINKPLSAPRKSMNKVWLAPSLNKPDGGSRSPCRGTRRDDSWPQENRRELSKSPPRFRPDGRRESQGGERSPPRTRIEEWQSGGSRMHGDRMSPPRRRPDGDTRPAGLLPSPLRSKMKMQDPERIQERDSSRHRYPDDNSGDRKRPPPAVGSSGDWLPHVAAMPSEFHSRERNMESIHSNDGRMSGGMPPGEIRTSGPPGHKIRARESPGREFRMSGPPGMGLDEGFSHIHPVRVDGGVMSHREHGPSASLPLVETRMGGAYQHGDTRTRSSFPGSPQRMANEFPMRGARFGRDLPPSEARIGGRMCFQEPTLGPGFQPQGQMIDEGYAHREERIINDFPFRDVRIDVSPLPLESKAAGPARMQESQMGGGFSPPPGRIGNDCPPPGGMAPSLQRRGGLAANERRTGNMPPLDAISSHSLSPGRRTGADIYSPEDRSKGNVPPDSIRSGAGYPHERGRGNEILPSPADRAGPYVSNTGGRTGMLHPENRSGRMVDDLPPQRMSGDLPPREGRMSDNFHPGARQGGNLPTPRDRVLPPPDVPLHSSPRKGRMIGDFPPFDRGMMGDLVRQEGRIMGDLLPREGRMMNELLSHERRTMGNLPPHEGRMMGDLSPREGRMMVDLPSHEGRMMGDFPPREGRMIDLASREGRAMSDFLPHGERMMGNFPPCEGRNISELPPQEGRMGGNLLPRERMSGDFPSHGGRIGGADVPPPHGRMVGDMPTGGRIMGNFPSGGRAGISDLPYRGGDMPPPGGRAGKDFLQHDKFGDDMPAPGERMIGDLPLGGRMGSGDFPTEGKVGSGVPPHGGRFGNDMPHHRERSSGDLPPHGGRLVGDLPSHGGRIGGDYPPCGGRFDGDLPPRDIGMSGDLQHLKVQSGSGDRWNRLQSNTRRSTNVGLKSKQKPIDERNLQFRSKDDFLQPKGGDDGAGPGHWDRIQSSNFGPPINIQECLKDVDLRNKEGFLQPKGRDGGRGIRRSRWSSPTRDIPQHPFKVEGDSQESSGAGPSYRFMEDRESRDGGRGIRRSRWSSPTRDIPQHPFKVEGDSQESSGAGPSYSFMENRESENSGRSQHARGPGTWKSGEPLLAGWKPPEAQKPDRPPPGSGRRSPLQVQSDIDDRILVGRNKPSPVGPRQNFQPQLGRPGKPLSPGQQMPGQQPLRGPKARRDDRSPYSRSAEVRQTSVGRPESGHQSPVAGGSGGRQRGSASGSLLWQSSQRSHIGEGGRLPLNIGRPTPLIPLQKLPRISGPNVLCSGGEIEDDIGFGPGWKPPQLGSIDVKCAPVGGDARKRLPEEGENEELAPYEQPFNQSVWDSNEPDAGLALHPGSEGHAGRTRESGGSRPQYLTTRSGNKPPGSIWQRVGGYVDDDEQHGTQGASQSHRFSNQNLSGGHFGESKERSKDFKESSRRGHESKEGRGDKKRFSPYRNDKGGFSRGSSGSRGRWKSPDKPRAGRW